MRKVFFLKLFNSFPSQSCPKCSGEIAEYLVTRHTLCYGYESVPVCVYCAQCDYRYIIYLYNNMSQISVYDLPNRSCFHRCNNSFCLWKSLYHCILNEFLINNLDVTPDRVTTLSDLRRVLDQFENPSDDENGDARGDDGATTNDENEFERTPIDGIQIVYETDDDEFS